MVMYDNIKHRATDKKSDLQFIAREGSDTAMVLATLRCNLLVAGRRSIALSVTPDSESEASVTS